MTSGAVLKKDRVRMEGRRRIGGPAVAPGSSAAPAGGAAAPGGQPAARLVSVSDAGALVEVTCACGRKTLLQCDFDAAAATGGGTGRNET